MKAVLWLFTVIFLVGCSEPRFLLTNGDQRNVSSYQGQWLLINYWAVWCKPCVEEIPELNALDEDASIQVLGFNFDRESGVELEKQIVTLGIDFPLISEDPAIIFDQPAPKGLPATMVISPDGRFEYWLMGPQTQASVREKLGL